MAVCDAVRCGESESEIVMEEGDRICKSATFDPVVNLPQGSGAVYDAVVAGNRFFQLTPEKST